MDGGWAVESGCCPRLGRLHTLDRVNDATDRSRASPGARQPGMHGFVRGSVEMDSWERGAKAAWAVRSWESGKRGLVTPLDQL